MDGLTNGWRDGRKEGYVGKWMKTSSDDRWDGVSGPERIESRKKQGKKDGWMNGWMDGWMDRCMDGWTDGWMAENDEWICK